MSKEKLCGIYMLISPSAKVYVGQAVNIYNRWMAYKNPKCSAQTRLYNSLKKYGYKKHLFEIMEECSLQKLNERERFWQDEYQVLNGYGLNCLLTKTDDKNGKGIAVSKQTRNKISAALKGKKKPQRSVEHNKNSSEAQKGKKQSVDTISKRIIKLKGKRRSLEACKNISLSKIGKPNKKLSETNMGHFVSEETKTKISETIKAKPKVKCPYCEVSTSISLLNRWHLNNCKQKNN